MLEYLYEHEYADSSEHDAFVAAIIPDQSGDIRTQSAAEDNTIPQYTLGKEDNVALNLCHLHSSMYAIGDKYQIVGLKAHSLKKFEQACQTSVQNALQPGVIHQIYEDPTPADKPLRDALVDILCRKSGQLNVNQGAVDAFQTSHSFASDMALALLRERQGLSHTK